MSEMREAIARLVEPEAWASWDDDENRSEDEKTSPHNLLCKSLKTADDILATLSQLSGEDMCPPSPQGFRESSMADEASRHVAPPSLPGQVVVIDYTNWRGERSERRIIPNMESLWFGFNDWHREAQWLLDAYDVEKGELRTFAMRDIHSWHSVSDRASEQTPLSRGDTTASTEGTKERCATCGSVEISFTNLSTGERYCSLKCAAAPQDQGGTE